MISVFLCFLIASFGVKAADSVKQATIYDISQDTDVYEEPSLEAMKIGNLHQGEVVYGISMEQEWLKIFINGVIGYVNIDAVSIPENVALLKEDKVFDSNNAVSEYTDIIQKNHEQENKNHINTKIWIIVLAIGVAVILKVVDNQLEKKRKKLNKKHKKARREQ